MKIEKDEFVKSLERVSPALGVNVLVPAFQCFIFDKGYVTATDGVIVVRSRCDSAPDLDCVIPGPQFLALLKSMRDKTIGLEVAGDKVIVTSARGSIKGNFTTVTRTDPPAIPMCDMKGSDNNFKRLFDGLSFCRYIVSKDETTGPRCGVRVENGKIFSTDKYRIARYDIGDSFPFPPITLPFQLNHDP